MPAPRCQVDFDDLAGAGGITYATADLTADGHPDLVVTHDNCDTTVGVSHWDVYPGSASGFAASPSSFAVPAPRCQVDFDALAGAGGVAYTTVDLTGDDPTDLVVTHDDCDDRRRLALGRVPWSSSGFAATQSSFAVPTPRCQVDFDALADAGEVTYTMVDLTGDGHADLVVTHDDCDTTVGVSHWDVYPWSSSGFAASPSSFAVPAPLPGRLR